MSTLKKVRESVADFSASIADRLCNAVCKPDYSRLPETDAVTKCCGRIEMKEICDYRVRNGKITREQFVCDAAR